MYVSVSSIHRKCSGRTPWPLHPSDRHGVRSTVSARFPLDIKLTLSYSEQTLAIAQVSERVTKTDVTGCDVYGKRTKGGTSVYKVVVIEDHHETGTLLKPL